MQSRERKYKSISPRILKQILPQILISNIYSSKIPGGNHCDQGEKKNDEDDGKCNKYEQGDDHHQNANGDHVNQENREEDDRDLKRISDQISSDLLSTIFEDLVPKSLHVVWLVRVK